MSNKQSIGVAFLGVGRMGVTHLRNLAGISGVRVIAVADLITERAERGRTMTGAELAVTDSAKAIEHPLVDAVVIVTPTGTHAQLIEQAVNAGKAVWSEKPIALNLAETQRVVELVREHKAPVQLGFMRRFDPGRFLVGEVEEVCAWGGVLIDERFSQANDADTAVTLLKFKNGVLGVMETSRRSNWGYDIRTEVAGSVGKLVIEAPQKTPLLFAKDFASSFDHYENFPDRFEVGYRLELEAFFDALREGRTPGPGPEDALETLRLALAVTKSWREKRPVKVSEITA